LTKTDAIITLMPLAELIAKAACRRYGTQDDEYLGEAYAKLVHLVIRRRQTNPEYVAFCLKRHMASVWHRNRVIRYPEKKQPKPTESFTECVTIHPFSEVDIKDFIESLSDSTTRSILELSMAGYNDTEIGAMLKLSRTTIADKRIRCHELARMV